MAPKQKPHLSNRTRQLIKQVESNSSPAFLEHNSAPTQTLSGLTCMLLESFYKHVNVNGRRLKKDKEEEESVLEPENKSEKPKKGRIRLTI